MKNEMPAIDMWRSSLFHDANRCATFAILPFFHQLELVFRKTYVSLSSLRLRRLDSIRCSHRPTSSSQTYSSKGASFGKGRAKNDRGFGRTENPYIWRNMEKLSQKVVQEVLEPSSIDTRGDIAVFTSSSELFIIYSRHSVTKRTQQIRGPTLFLLFRAFQDTIRQHAQVLLSSFLSKLLR